MPVIHCYALLNNNNATLSNNFASKYKVLFEQNKFRDMTKIFFILIPLSFHLQVKAQNLGIKFNTELSTENAASGTNLTEATHIIFMDPIKGCKEEVLSIENQAIGRAVRIGQENQVIVYKLIIKNTIEEKIDIGDVIIENNHSTQLSLMDV